MINKITLRTAYIVQEISIDTNLPLFFSLLIELCSNLQILALTLLPLLGASLHAKNGLSYAISSVISYIEPFKLFDPFKSDSGFLVTFVLCSLYLISYLLILSFISFQVMNKKRIGKLLAKFMSIGALIHSKVMFYLIHCFLMRVISGNCAEYSSNSLSCSVGMIILCSFLFAFNTGLALFQEFFCYQIHQNTQTYGIKNNSHNVMKLIHKMLVIMLFYFTENSAEIVTVFNILLTVFDLSILHLRLPYYNMRMLQLSISCSTISTTCAILSVGKFIDGTEGNTYLIMMLIAPLLVKGSLMKLRRTLSNIISLKFTNIYQAVHLPILLRNYSRTWTIASNLDIFPKTSLKFIGFMSSKQGCLPQVNQKQENKDFTKEAEKSVYKKVLREMMQLHKKYPKNELIATCIAQMYIQMFNDNYTALSFISKLGNQRASFAGKISLQAISNSLMMSNQNMNQGNIGEMDAKEKKRESHLNYFTSRQKTLALKRFIQREIEQHLLLWRNLNNKEINVLSAIHQASLVTRQVRSVMNYWARNFEGQEVLYANASIIYALYLEVVRAIPTSGKYLFKKARDSVNNKWHIYRDVIDVAVGESAVIVASIESDKIGRIIDASSSVKKLFKANKQGFIGSNLASILPNFIASKHNDLIKAYQKQSKEEIDHCINSYAKTLQDDYFKVEVMLHPSPLIYKELSLFTFIKKTSDYQSLLIVDQKGYIVEHSKDLSLPLNLPSFANKRAYAKIETLCPSFKVINSAFNMLYKSSKDAPVVESSGQLTPGRSQKQASEVEYNDTAFPTLQRLNIYSMENEVFTPKGTTSMRIRDNKSSILGELPLASAKTLHANMTVDEAQVIWDQYKGNIDLNFTPYNNNKNLTLTSQFPKEIVRYQAKIEPFCFDGAWYKVIELRDESKLKGSIPSFVMQNIDAPASSKRFSKTAGDNTFADNFQTEKERSGVITEDNSENEAESQNKDGQKSSKGESPMKEVKEVGMEDFEITQPQVQIIAKQGSSQAQSVADTKLAQRMIKRKLNALKQEPESRNFKLLSWMITFTILCMITAICVHFIYTNKSLQEMRDSNNLTMLVNSRLSKTALNWQALMILYSRSSKLRPIDYRIPKYQEVTRNASMDVIANAKELTDAVDRLGNKDVVKELYAKTVNLYEPLTQEVFNSEAVNQFSANQVLIDYYLWIAKYSGSFLDLVNDRKMLFVLNNTANNYLLKQDSSIAYISNFFQETKKNNGTLLKAIAVVEVLVIIIPVILIFVVFAGLVKKYNKLFHTLSRLHERSLLQRITKLEDVSQLFEESLEDDINAYLENDFKDKKDQSQGLEILTSKRKNKNSKSQNKQYRTRALVINIMRYVILAFILTMIVIALVVFAFDKSIQNLDELDAINKKSLAVYGVRSQVQMLLPSFYISIIFNNNTNYKIRNDNPSRQLLSQYEVLGNANNRLIAAFSDSNNEITDPLIKDIFIGKPCKYVTSIYYSDCLIKSQGESFGLLGLHSLFYQICEPMKTFATSKIPTWTFGVAMSNLYTSMNNNTHFVIYDLYNYIADHLVELFVSLSESKREEMLKILIYTLVVALVALKLIAIVVLAKLKMLDLGIRRILKQIPDRVVQENKLIGFYLARHFPNEFHIPSL